MKNLPSIVENYMNGLLDESEMIHQVIDEITKAYCTENNTQSCPIGHLKLVVAISSDVVEVRDKVLDYIYNLNK